eukprot:TRINITY_DN10719_c0_g1_i1.p1 TRINITY_DN10719_c0_g1~~TRINITY_DN10719_c0_g1_i1.p1  ORF type:complete len:242 (-),score=52.33 TRINITY_DN10719_c0_g1_i1:85-810(-)
MTVAGNLGAASYLVGSALYVYGSVVFHPAFSSRLEYYLSGVWCFIAGSVLYVLPAAHSIFGVVLAGPAPDPTERDRLVPDLCDEAPVASRDGANYCPDGSGRSRPAPGRFRSVICGRAFVSSMLTLLGGLCFLFGSVGFLPEYGARGALAGNWLFRCGSTTYTFNNCWALVALLRTGDGRRKGLDIAVILLNLGGSTTFFAGGLCFLFKHPVPGSILWAIGSTFFAVGSALYWYMVLRTVS